MLFGALLASGSRASDLASAEADLARSTWGEALVKGHYDFIWRLLRRMGLSAPDCDDAAQQVFLVALSPRERKVEAGSERSFLFGAALRVCQEFRRKRTRNLQHEPVSPELLAPGHQPDELSARQEAWRRLQTILEAMPEEVRVAFILFELEGMTAPEISALADVPVGTVASRLRRGRDLFQSAVRALETPAEPGGLRA
jgi:RNA polymerase sigma-70 factor (ECF subfamily)